MVGMEYSTYYYWYYSALTTTWLSQNDYYGDKYSIEELPRMGKGWPPILADVSVLVVVLCNVNGTWSFLWPLLLPLSINASKLERRTCRRFPHDDTITVMITMTMTEEQNQKPHHFNWQAASQPWKRQKEILSW